MPNTNQTGFRLSDEQLAKLEFLKERDGIPFAEQIRRALKMFFDERGVTDDHARRHLRTHRKGGQRAHG